MSTPLSDTDITGFNSDDTEALTVFMRGGDTLERAIERTRRLKSYQQRGHWTDVVREATTPARRARAYDAWTVEDRDTARGAFSNLPDRFCQGLQDIKDGYLNTDDAVNALVVLEEKGLR